jgi:hypothetical protein
MWELKSNWFKRNKETIHQHIFTRFFHSRTPGDRSVLAGWILVSCHIRLLAARRSSSRKLAECHGLACSLGTPYSPMLCPSSLLQIRLRCQSLDDGARLVLLLERAAWTDCGAGGLASNLDELFHKVLIRSS